MGILGWAVDLSIFYVFGGFTGVLVGFGIMATKLIFNIEGLTEKAFEEWKKKVEEEFEAKLDALEKQLEETDGVKDESLLRELRTLFKTYKTSVQEGKIKNNLEISEKLSSLFNACVQKLTESYELWKSSKTFSGEIKKETLKARDSIIKDVAASTSYFAKTLHELFIIKKDESKDLAELRKELDNSVEVAKKTEERLANLYSRE